MCDDNMGTCESGECVPSDACEGVDCSDGNECTSDLCMDGNCSNPPVADGTECDAGAGTCQSGVCVEIDPCEGVDCSDGNECTADLCVDGACSNPPVDDGTSCDDTMGTCQSGMCVPDDLCEGIDCSDGNECTNDVCTDGVCSNPPADDGTSCTCPTCGAEGVCMMGVCEDPCEGLDCSDGNQCTADLCDLGICANPNVDQDTLCDQGGGKVCDGAGTCVECNRDAQCDVELSEECIANTCVASVTPCGSQSRIVSVGCTNSVTTAQSPFPYTLIVDVPEPIIGGTNFEAILDGVGVFPEFFLDAAQGVVPGGVSQAILEDFLATVQVRSGASGPDVGLGVDITALDPGPTQFCTYPSSTVCTADSDCIVAPCKDPVLLANIPTSTDCVGVCEPLGKKLSQCDLNGFCVTGPLIVDLQDETGAYTADTTGPVLWGWADQGVPGLLTCPDAACDQPVQADGCYDLPAAVFSNPLLTPQSGIRVNVAGALFVAIECAGGEDGGTCSVTTTQGCTVDADCPGAETCIGVGADDDVICPTPDSSLISCPVN
jgi:hypothetical protein